jgi:hypothetical protein
MPEHKLYISDETSGIIKEVGFDIETEENKSGRMLLGQFCPIDKAKGILDILNLRDSEGKIKYDLWLGLEDRGSEIGKCWQEGNHPWWPELMTIPKNKNFDAKNLLESDVAPITQETLFKELEKLLKLCSQRSSAIKLSLIDVKPAWDRPSEIYKEINAESKFFLEEQAYEVRSDDGITFDQWKPLLKAIIAQFLYFLPDLKNRQTSDLEFEAVIKDDCKPDPALKCDGLCGAWYIINVEYGVHHEHLEIRVPVGLIKPGSGPDLAPGLVPIKDDKANVYVYGLKFRFLCPGTSSPKDQEMREYAEKIQKNLIFLNREMKSINLSIDATGILMNTVQQFSINADRTKWQGAPTPEERATFAKRIAPKVIGNGPFVIFMANGVHLLQKGEIGEWCARNQLLDKLFCSPPWSNTASWLDFTLDKLFINEGSEWSPPGRNFPGGCQALEDDVWDVDKKCFTNASDYSKQLLTVSASKTLGLPQTKQAAWDLKLGPRGITIRDFRKKTKAERKVFIDDAWKMLTTAYKFDQQAKKMWDPPYSDDKPGQPLPTSWCPILPGSQNYHKRLPADSLPWNLYVVGFRIDGTWSDLLKTRERFAECDEKGPGKGMTQWRKDSKYMYTKKRMAFKETILDDSTQFIFWNKNNDTFNETAICVSRNFFGATAFPERNSDGEYALFALDCFNLKGFDTEAEQMKLGRPWRPGEKAFEQIRYEDVIGWVRINRTGGEKGTFWSFEIFTKNQSKFNAVWDNWEINNDWKSKHEPDYCKLRIDYITDELEAWRGANRIDGTRYDFAK